MDAVAQTAAQQAYTVLFYRLQHTANAKYFSGNFGLQILVVPAALLVTDIAAQCRPI